MSFGGLSQCPECGRTVASGVVIDNVNYDPVPMVYPPMTIPVRNAYQQQMVQQAMAHPAYYQGYTENVVMPAPAPVLPQSYRPRPYFDENLTQITYVPGVPPPTVSTRVDKIGLGQFDPDPQTRAVIVEQKEERKEVNGPYGPGGSRNIVRGTYKPPPLRVEITEDIPNHSVLG